MAMSLTGDSDTGACWPAVLGLAAALAVTVAGAPSVLAQPDRGGAERAGTERARAEQAENAHAESMPAEHTSDSVNLVVRVRDTGGEPVRGASVWVRSGEGWVEGQSDISGNADFEDLPSGKTRVQVVATGWNSSGGSVDLDDREVTIEVALDRRAAPQSTAGAKAEAEREARAGETAEAEPGARRHARAARSERGQGAAPGGAGEDSGDPGAHD